eukprot:CAMPEP_0198136730 /NCGR_PEP_ID=MMETSP1443-20131203/353_1 /TAXON_ID=186043 /ORGANISM="Entomoneis sp., Strain CCMP2396" /LENGTH=156 /DNA_ID=CAMNT_0043798001 /DNA_START=109 /DNA_END=579 /DNA_ORIENTATION=-
MISLAKITPVLKKAITFNIQPTEETFPELPDVLVWFRFVLAIMYGIYVGTNQMTTATMLIQALNLIAFVPTMYAKFYLNISSGVFDTETVLAGLPNAMALMFLIWIFMFTMAHEKEEGQLSALLLGAALGQSDGSGVGEETVQTFATTTPPPDTEF